MAAMLLFTLTAFAQVTTSSVSGIVSAGDEVIIGATVQAKHVPTGTIYKTTTNMDGNYYIEGARAGGPYTIIIQYVGLKTVSITGVNLTLGENTIVNADMKDTSKELNEVLVTSSKLGRNTDRSSSITSFSKEEIARIPSASRSINDILKYTPQSSTSLGLAIGGGTYRQSNVTIDGASFNNTFGMGSNLPGGGTPISLDALDQITVSLSPFDVRQSGFNGGAISAITKSGDNKFRASVYSYLTSNAMTGNKVADQDWERTDGHINTYGISLGGPLVKDKLFYFINAEYEDNVMAGPTAMAGEGSTHYSNTERRPTLNQLNSFSNYLQNKYGYMTGAWQNYNLKLPGHRLIARLDWNVNTNNTFNIRLTNSSRKENTESYPSRFVGSDITNWVYGGDYNAYGSESYYGMSSLSSRYTINFKFTSIAAELNSKFGKFNNMLRATYSYQDQPREQEYNINQPVVEILMSDGQGHTPTWAMTGDIYTRGNRVQTKNFVITDEIAATLGKHQLLAGVQYESTNTLNTFAPGAAGYYAFEATPEQVTAGDWQSVFAAKPNVFAITYGNNANLSQFEAQIAQNTWSFYLQDNINFSDRFRASLGVRFEAPSYPALKDAYNSALSQLDFGGMKYINDQVPDTKMSISPRVGFNWDVMGTRQLVIRGGSGLFVGRMPFVWLVKAVSDAGMGQTSYFTNNPAEMPNFTMSQKDMLQQINAKTSTSVPYAATVLSKDLSMQKTWKSSLAMDAKLPGDIDFTLEGLFNKELNPVVVNNKGIYWDGHSTVNLGNGDVRHLASSYNGHNLYMLENAGKDAYYYSVSAQLHKFFTWGLDLTASYTYSGAKTYSQGVGDQTSEAYANSRNSLNFVNDNETGNSSYVSPNRVLVEAAYKLKEGKNMASTFSLIYDGSEFGYLGGVGFTRYSYAFANNVTGDAAAEGNLIKVPASREELNNWNFADNGMVDGKVYTADMQRDDFWSFINQDDYLSEHKGEYTERGGAKMPWHHQFDFKFVQDFTIKAGSQDHAFQFGVDIINLGNLLNKSWGTYKTVSSNALLNYSNGNYTYNTVNNARHLKTFEDYASSLSTYKVMFTLRYKFN